MGDGYVYVVGSGRSDDPVKIGWSGTPEGRMKALQTGAPYVLQMLATHPGPVALEGFLHREFAPYRIHGEWFLIQDPIHQVVEKVRTWDGKMPASGRKGSEPLAFDRILGMLRRDSGVTGDDFRVFFYCLIKTQREGDVTVKDIAEHLGLTPQAARRIAKKLSDNNILLISDLIGRTIRYGVSPHILFTAAGGRSGGSDDHPEPTLPGQPTP